MRSYTAQVHLYGSVAVVTLCARRAGADVTVCLAGLVRVLSGIGADVNALVLDLDCAPSPAPGDALASIDSWAAEREITVVAFSPSSNPMGTRPPGTLRPGAPAVRAAPAGPAGGGTRGPPGDEAAPARLRRDLGVRALVHQAAGIRQARHQAHPCS
ncbi:hypothetical protein [Streptomyces sp. NPDC089799]|uniref:hypothetical protein n=1 Tax=Streptomyces sp. NPDC089799 TaxID=3155066 RepID=UPI0034209EE5